MAIALAIFGVAFAAICVWLGVRIFNRRERWATWTLDATVIVGGLLGIILKVVEQERENEQARRELQKLLEQTKARFSKQ